MAQRELAIVTTLKDNASKQLSGLKGRLEKMKPAFRKMAMAGTAGLAGISYAAKETVEAAGMAEGAWNKFNTVFGDNQQMMQNWVKDVREEMPSATHEIARMTAGVGDLLKPMGIAEDQAANMSKQSVELATAIAAFNDVNPKEVLEAMKSGFAGMSRPLRQFGIDARQTSLEAKAMKMGLLEAGESFKQLQGQEKTQIRMQALVQQMYDQSSDALAGQEENMDSYIWKKQKMTAATKDLSVSLGKVLLPIIDNVVRALTPIIEKITDWIEENPKLVKNIMLAVGAISALLVVVGGLGLILSSVSAPLLAIVGLIAGLGYIIVKSGDKISDFVSSILESEFMQALKLLAERYLVSLRKGLTRLWENLKELWNFIKPVLIPVLKFLGKVIGAILLGAIMAALAAFRAIIAVIQVVIKFIKELLEAVVNMAKDWIESVKWLAGKVSDKFKQIKTFIKEELNSIKETWKIVWNAISDFFVGIWDGIKSKVSSVVDWIMDKVNAVKDVVGGIGDVLGGVGRSVAGAAKSVVGVDDALITKGGKVVKLNPKDNLLAFKGGMGGGVSVNINAPVYGMDEEDVARKLGDKIISQLNLSRKL